MIFRVLENLLILDGERLSYRTLDVEQIGSVYETMMGFDLESGPRPVHRHQAAKPHGAPTTINLEELLAVAADKRAKWLKEQTDQSLTGAALNALKEAKTPEDVVAALERKVAARGDAEHRAAGAMVLQPSDERRRSGSHYTPRTLTEPIVRKTLEPILERLGRKPTPEQILDLKSATRRWARGVPGGSLPPARRGAGQGLARPQAGPAIPPDEDECCTPAAWSPSAACTAWTRTRWRSTWPSCRSGWRRWRRTTPSRSSTTPCAAAIRWSA